MKSFNDKKLTKKPHQNEVIEVALVSLLLFLTDLTHCSVNSVVTFGELNADWDSERTY